MSPLVMFHHAIVHARSDTNRAFSLRRKARRFQLEISKCAQKFSLKTFFKPSKNDPWASKVISGKSENFNGHVKAACAAHAEAEKQTVEHKVKLDEAAYAKPEQEKKTVAVAKARESLRKSKEDRAAKRQKKIG